jgi:Protein of unknown function (DUF3386)
MNLATATDAQALFRAAYENRYTWDANFPGYKADVTVTQGDQVYTGKMQINADMTFETTDPSNDKALELIKGQVWEIAVHRVRKTFTETHGKNTFAFGETDATGAVEIIMGGKAEGDRYKLRNNEVCMVHRHIHGVVVTINTHSSHQTEAGYLSHTYDSVYRDAKTGEFKGSSAFEDIYENIGGYYILTSRVITADENGQKVPTTYSFSNIQTL